MEVLSSRISTASVVSWYSVCVGVTAHATMERANNRPWHQCIPHIFFRRVGTDGMSSVIVMSMSRWPSEAELTHRQSSEPHPSSLTRAAQYGQQQIASTTIVFLRASTNSREQYKKVMSTPHPLSATSLRFLRKEQQHALVALLQTRRIAQADGVYTAPTPLHSAPRVCSHLFHSQLRSNTVAFRGS